MRSIRSASSPAAWRPITPSRGRSTRHTQRSWWLVRPPALEPRERQERRPPGASSATFTPANPSRQPTLEQPSARKRRRGAPQRRRAAHPHWRLRVRTALLFGSKMSRLRRVLHRWAPACSTSAKITLSRTNSSAAATIGALMHGCQARALTELAAPCPQPAAPRTASSKAALPLALCRKEPSIRHLVYLECGIRARSSGDDHQSKHDSDHPLGHVPLRFAWDSLNHMAA